jgi:hypothetical protein
VVTDVAPSVAVPRVRPLAVPAWQLLGAIVALGFAVRALVASLRATPVLWPDEYTYAALARGIGEHGLPVVRGELAHFPALLEPLLTAPFWLAGDPELAYRLTQAFNALAMSLAAVPVFLLVRTLGLDVRVALGSAALAVAAPGVAYSGYVLADPVSYPLALTAVFLAVRALATPTPRLQVAFLVVAGLATFARIQYAVLVPAFFAAAVAVERGRAVAVMRRLRLSLALVAGGFALLLVLGPARALGAYWGGASTGVGPIDVARWLPEQALLFTFGAGVALVPAAVAGLVAALARPRSRAEAAFAGMTAALVVALVGAAAAIAALDSARFQERYLIALVPLLAPAAALAWTRGAAVRWGSLALALVLFVAAVRVPVSGYVLGGSISDSPTLWGARYLAFKLDIGTGGLVFSLGIAALALVAAAAAFRPQRLGLLTILAAVSGCAALSAGAHAHDTMNSSGVRDVTFPHGERWIDELAPGSVALLQPPLSSRQHALIHLFWNSSVDEVLRLGNAPAADLFAAPAVEIDDRGTLRAGAAHVTKPLLVDESMATVELRGAELLRRSDTMSLWRLGRAYRFSALTLGRYPDGFVTPSGVVRVWPDASGRVRGTLRFTLSIPRSLPGAKLTLTATNGFERKLELEPGESTRIAVPVDVARPFDLSFSSSSSVWTRGRVVGAWASRPTFDRN